MKKEYREFFDEMKKIVSKIESLAAKYDLEDRLVCAAMYGIIDDAEEDDENIDVLATYHFAIEDDVELYSVTTMMHKAFSAMTGDSKMRSLFGDDISLN
jgi:hypothetical protein